jgi:DUF4097 and DUF4098 domain-containing protein YvlB
MYQRTIDARFNPGGATVLEINAASGNIDVMPSLTRRQAPMQSQGLVAIYGEIESASQEQADAVRLRGELRGNRFVVTITEPAVTHGDFSKHYAISFPATMALRVNDSAGNIRVNGAFTNIVLHTSAGNVRASIAPQWSGDTIQLWSNAGNIEVDAPSGFHGVLTATTDAGRIENDLNLPSSGNGTKLDLATNAGNIMVRD